jgi:hypothetical protein
MIMRTTRRNTPDPISPQNPVIKKDIGDGDDRIQSELQDNISVEEIYSGDNDETKKKAENQDTASRGESEVTAADESGL